MKLSSEEPGSVLERGKTLKRLFQLTVLATLLSVVAPAGAAPPLHQASGGGFFEAPASGGGFNEFMFAFNVKQLNDWGDAKGQFEQHNRTRGSALHMDIVYVEFGGDEGNEVWLIGEVTKSINANAEIGDQRAVRLKDNGEGANAPLDMRSKLSSTFEDPFVTPLSEQEFPLIVLTSGNIQIR